MYFGISLFIELFLSIYVLISPAFFSWSIFISVLVMFVVIPLVRSLLLSWFRSLVRHGFSSVCLECFLCVVICFVSCWFVIYLYLSVWLGDVLSFRVFFNYNLGGSLFLSFFLSLVISLFLYSCFVISICISMYI